MSGAIIDRAAGLRSFEAAPIMNYEGNCSDMTVLSSFQGFSKLLVYVEPKLVISSILPATQSGACSQNHYGVEF